MNMIEFDVTTQSFHLHNEKMSYLMQLTNEGVLTQLYLGRPIKAYSGNHTYPLKDRGFSGPIPGTKKREVSKDTLLQAFSSQGSMDYRIPASILRRHNGSSLHDFRYHSHQISQGKPHLQGLPQAYTSGEEAETLCLTLKDCFQELYIELLFTIYENRGVIARSSRLLNKTDQPLQIEKLASLQLDFGFNGRFEEVLSFPGAHALERQLQRETLTKGVKHFESRRGTSSHQMNSFIALASKQTDEFTGEALGIHLLYSGNHAFELELDQINQLRLVAGINPANFTWQLASGESFQTPEALLFYSSKGLNGMSQEIHPFLRERVARGKQQLAPRPIVMNNWEGTYFDFTSEKLEAMIDEAAELGIEMFVLDDGWFGHRDRDDSSLGDWFEYQGKLANGLAGIADYTHKKGLKFGLWFEPEMISWDSKLYREHPDYLMQEPNRTPASSREQFVLDMGRKEVRDAIETQLRKILDTVAIDYIKWDMNRSLSDVFSLALDENRQGETLHRYMLGVYEMLENLTQDYPEILWEGCSGGGGRFDAGFLYYMPQSWTSDNTDAVDRVKIQYSTSLAYPISSITGHVSAVPNHQTGRTTSLKTREAVAMSSVFGYELDPTTLSQMEKAEIKEKIAFYQEHRSLIQYGNFYRLLSPYEGNVAAWSFVSPNQEEFLLFVNRTLASGQSPFYEVRLTGLDPVATYEHSLTGQCYKGDELMHLGLYFPDFVGDFQADLLYFRRVSED